MATSGRGEANPYLIFFLSPRFRGKKKRSSPSRAKHFRAIVATPFGPGKREKKRGREKRDDGMAFFPLEDLLLWGLLTICVAFRREGGKKGRKTTDSNDV